MKTKQFLARFSRITTSGKFISEIDGLRFVAIGTVLLFHIGASAVFLASQGTLKAGRWLTAITGQGFHGVELFFIISGFILGLPFASHTLKNRPSVHLGKYFLRRLTRLEPPYMLSMFLIFLMLVFLKGENGVALLPHLLVSLVYLHNIIFSAPSTINNVAWSLEIEVQFYVLVPLLSAIFLVRNKAIRRSIIVAACLVSITDEYLFISPGGEFYYTIVRFLYFFLIGFLLADIYLIDWNEHPQKRRAWDLVSLIGWPLLFVIWNIQQPVGAVASHTLGAAIGAYVYPLLAFLLYYAAFKGPISNIFFTNPWITTIGGMCYTIYLLHDHVIGLIERASRYLVFTHSYLLNYIFQSVIIIPIVLAVSGIYFILIEKPCMRKDWPQRAYARVRQWVFTTEPVERIPH